MNPHISLPRQNGAAQTFGGTAPASRSEGLRMPRFFKRYARLSYRFYQPLDEPGDPTIIQQHMDTTGRRTLTCPGYLQIIQIPTNGFRDGNMGDDESSDSAEEGLQINILPCKWLTHSLIVRRPHLTDNSRNVRGFLNSLRDLPREKADRD